MKNAIKIGFLLLSGLACSEAISAMCTQYNNALNGLVGLDSGSGRLYAAVSSSSNECSCDQFRFKPEDTDVNMALSILLSAKMADKKVRIDLDDATDCNTAVRVYVQ